MVQSQIDTARVLLVAETTGYQIRTFGDVAARCGISLIFATDRCHQLDDPWRDSAVPIRFHNESESVDAIIEKVSGRGIDGVVAVGDRPAVLGALAAKALGVRFHPADAARIATNKLDTRSRFRDAGVPVPWFKSVPLEINKRDLGDVPFPCVVKPLTLSASRGVIRVDSPTELETAIGRLSKLLRSTSVLSRREKTSDIFLIEKYIAGREVAIEGFVTNGHFRMLTIFDKPDLLEGPFFEESIYVTPTRLTEFEQRRVEQQVDIAIQALGLTHGPVHAECRLGSDFVFVLEVAPRSIGGLCSKVLRFEGPRGEVLFEELILRHALAEPLDQYRLVSDASAVMMMPVPQAGMFKKVDGVETARSMPLIEDIIVTAKRDQRFVPWPEGSSYPGFIFARGDTPADVVTSLRNAYAALRFDVVSEIPLRFEREH